MRIHLPVSIDRDASGECWLSRDNIVISDSSGDVVCLVPAEGDGELDFAEARAEAIVAALNATAPEPDVYAEVKCSRCGNTFRNVRVYVYPLDCVLCCHTILTERNPLLLDAR